MVTRLATLVRSSARRKASARLRRSLSAAGAAVLTASLLGTPSGQAQDRFGFTMPVQLPAPGSGRALEASIAVSPDGPVYAVSLRSGASDLFRSTDRGRSYNWMRMLTAADLDGGKDADVAIAPVPNAAGHRNVYAIDLWAGSVNLVVSRDGGETWDSDPIVALVPGAFAVLQPSQPLQERPWVVAEGPSTVYVSYNNVGHMIVRCTTDPAIVCGPPVEAVDLTQRTGPGFPGGFDIDPRSGRLYQAYVSTRRSGPPRSQVWVAVSSDGGLTFRQSLVHEDPEGLSVANFFPIPGVDLAGNVYVTWSNGRAIRMAASTDGGETWGPAVRLNSAPSVVGREPWVAGGSAGVVNVVWYGADALNGTWYPYFAQVRGAVVDGAPNPAPSVSQAAISTTPAWFGDLGVRPAFLDFFEVAIDPLDGAAVTAFSTATGVARSFSTRQCAGPSAIDGLTVTPC